MTAEFAVALPAVLLLLALLLAGSAAGVTQLRLEEAARAGARALARGDDAAAVDVIVRRLAGNAAASAVASDGEWLSVTVSGRVPGRRFAPSLDPLGPRLGPRRIVRSVSRGQGSRGLAPSAAGPRRMSRPTRIAAGIRSPGPRSRTRGPEPADSPPERGSERGAGTVLALGLGMLVIIAAVLILLLAQSAVMASGRRPLPTWRPWPPRMLPGESLRANRAPSPRTSRAGTAPGSSAARKGPGHGAGPHGAGSPDARGRGHRTGQGRARRREPVPAVARWPEPVPAAPGHVPPASARPAAGPRGPAARCASGPWRP